MDNNWLYLDMNIYNRPFDDQRQARVRLETIACQILYELIQHDRFRLAWSFMLEYENSLNPFPERRDEIRLLSRLAKRIITPSEHILAHTEVFEHQGLRNHDAVHLACAEVSGCQAFVTCDDKLIKKAQTFALRSKVMNPVTLVQEVNNEYARNES